VLREWEQTARAARQFRCTFTWSAREPTSPRRTPEAAGELFLSRPHRLRVELRDPAGSPAVLILCTGGQAHLYDYHLRKVYTAPCDRPSRLFPSGLHTDGSADGRRMARLLEEWQWVFAGLPVPDLRRRFAVHLEREDEHWTCLRLTAKEREGPAPDADWQVVLARQGRWVRRLWRSGCLGELIVDFTEPIKSHLPAATWEPPFKEPPPGWTTSP
jgi:hypothetical protein